MDYSKPADDGQKVPPPYDGRQSAPVGTPVIPPQDYHPPPPAHRAHGGSPSQWTTSLFGCFSDIPNCCITFWFPCITFGQIADIVDRGGTSCGASGALYTLIALVTGIPCMYSCFYRTKMRRQYGLPETPCNDLLVHCCCELCALCQEYRDLKNRGFDMYAGWDGNLERQSRGGATTAPVVEGGMSR